MNSYLELTCIRAAKAYGIPQGILESNGVVMVFNPSGSTNNLTSLSHAAKMFPALWLHGMTVDFS